MNLDAKIMLFTEEETFLTMKSTRTLFISLGWFVYGIEGKENFLAIYQLPDREVQILYNDEITTASPRFDVGFSVTTGILSAVCRAIDPINSQSLPDLQLYFNKNGLKIVEEKINASRLELELDYTLEWAMESIDLLQRIGFRYGIPPWQTSKIDECDNAHYSLLHIGTLALLNNIESLQSYHKSFVEREHLGFDNNIQKHHLERAMIMAKEIAKVKQPSYDLIKKMEKSFLAA